MILFAITALIALAAGLGVAFSVAIVWEWLDRRYGFPRLG
jgi:uncharacterized protein involved in exopolysaccharide biosynthesis